jgi:diguanylate cyclase (GGDEF)-like protein/PAS domain S-box-containing protein
MKNDNKTKKQLVYELTELRSQNAALKKSITGNISDEIAVEEARRYAESIVETVREPLLVLDADLKIISANRYFYKTFKVNPSETIGSFIYDLGNKQWDIPKLRELLEEVLPEKEAFDDFEVAHTFQNIGHKIMLLNACRIYRKDIGAKKMILLAIEDITERREIENGLEKARKELEVTKISEDAAREYAESIINTIREPLIALDHDLRVVTASRSFYVVFKVNPEETVGQLIYDLGNKQWDIPKLRELLETILPQKTTFDQYEVEHNFADIGRRIMLLNARQIQRVLGKELVILLAIEDITERKKTEAALQESEEKYRELSIVDSLTHLYNSRQFYNQLRMEIDRSNRYEQPLTLLLLDLDNFKAFNDAYGHVEGDQVLRRLGQVVKRCLRETDFAYRYGGEEFTVLMPMTTSADGTVTAERIRTELKKENFSPAPGQNVHVKVSIGIAQFKSQEGMKAFVHRVDQLMYQAKNNGKDRVCSES